MLHKNRQEVHSKVLQKNIEGVQSKVLHKNSEGSHARSRVLLLVLARNAHTRLYVVVVVQQLHHVGCARAQALRVYVGA